MSNEPEDGATPVRVRETQERQEGRGVSTYARVIEVAEAPIGAEVTTEPVSDWTKVNE